MRAEIKNGSELGMSAKKFMDKGELVPDTVIINLITNYVKTLQVGQGWFFDGFPRTEA